MPTSTIGPRCAASVSASASITRSSWRAPSPRSACPPSRSQGNPPTRNVRRHCGTSPPDVSAVIFSVDLFNEGVDIPAVDTILMLRPTESPTLFLQQLGRGLRKAADKSACTVLDFVGTHRREFRFDLRYRALLGGTRSDIARAVKDGFPFLPAGCHMELDRVASDVVLRSIRDAIPTRWPAKVEELRALRTARGRDVTLRRVPRRDRPRDRGRLRRQSHVVRTAGSSRPGGCSCRSARGRPSPRRRATAAHRRSSANSDVPTLAQFRSPAQPSEYE